VSDVQLETLGDALERLWLLDTLRVTRRKHQQEQQQLAGAAAAAAANSCLALFLGQITWLLDDELLELHLQGHSIGREEETELAGMKGLWKLVLSDCDLDDCSVVAIASGLHETMEVLNISDNPRVTDACLPALARLQPGIEELRLKGTGITKAGLQRYLPAVKLH
jgi:hypothetical protein